MHTISTTRDIAHAIRSALLVFLITLTKYLGSGKSKNKKNIIVIMYLFYDLMLILLAGLYLFFRYIYRVVIL